MSLAITFVLLNVGYGLVSKCLTYVGVPAGLSLLFRGVVCLWITVMTAIWQREYLVPKLVQVQGVRFILSGLSVLCTLESFKYLPVSAVFLISRMDLPLSVLFAVFSSHKPHPLELVCSLVALVVLILGLFSLGLSSERVLGISAAFLGTLTIAISYLFLKSAAATENAGVIVLIPGLSSLFYGLIVGLPLLEGFNPSLEAMALLCGLGGTTFLMYRFMRRLFQQKSLLSATLPMAFIPVLSMPVDRWVFDLPINVGYAVAVVMVSLILSVPSLARMKKNG